jgi:hypothetical protein
MSCDEKETAAEPETREGEPHNENFVDGDIRVGNFTISGVRTYSIILLIMATYCYLALKQGSEAAITGLRDLALMAAGFLFGYKALNKK